MNTIEWLIVAWLGIVWVLTLVLAYNGGYLRAIHKVAYPILDDWKESNERLVEALKREVNGG